MCGRLRKTELAFGCRLSGVDISTPRLRAGLTVVLVGTCGAAAAQTGGRAHAEMTARGGASGERLLVFGGVRWGTSSVTPRIYLIRADGTGMRRITDARNVEDVDPAWRPDGRRIAFARRNARGWRLYVMNPDGRRLRAISPVLSDAVAPAWSPDGRQLAFQWLPRRLPARGSLSQQIAVIDANGKRLRTLTKNATFRGGAAHPAWSPDGKTILFSARKSLAENARADVWSVRPSGRGLHRLIVNATDPAWSPSGREFAFSRRGDLYTAASGGRILRRLTHGHYADSAAPAWSPDGSEIAYDTTHYDKQAQAQSECLTVIGADGSRRREITSRDPDFWATSPDWRPGA